MSLLMSGETFVIEATLYLATAHIKYGIVLLAFKIYIVLGRYIKQNVSNCFVLDS